MQSDATPSNLTRRESTDHYRAGVAVTVSAAVEPASVTEASAMNKAANRVRSDDGRNWEIVRQHYKAQTLNANAEDAGLGRMGALAMNLELAPQRLNYLNNHVLNIHKIGNAI